MQPAAHGSLVLPTCDRESSTSPGEGGRYIVNVIGVPAMLRGVDAYATFARGRSLSAFP
jgi:hypothetical protein